jgi:hypothetical protein
MQAWIEPAGLSGDDMNTLLPESSDMRLVLATDINDSGWIVGCGVHPDGMEHAFLLKPIHEPATAIIMLAGGMAVFRSRGRIRWGTMSAGS